MTRPHGATLGNSRAATKALDTSTPPWMYWKGSRPGLIVKFIETYCVTPKGHGAGQPLMLGGFQIDAIEQLFSPGVRTGEFSLGRGNGKSTFVAAVALAHLCLERYSPQLPLIATTLRQIERSTYEVAVSMAKHSPEIASRILTYSSAGNKKICAPWNDGEAFPISSDVEGLQGLDPSLALIDEVGFVSPGSWEALKLAGGKRPESLVVGLGTTGSSDSALYALHLLNEAHALPPSHCRINYSAPDGCSITDRSAWHAANPALAEGFLAIDALESDVTMSPESHFRRFRLNQWVDDIGAASWLGPRAAEVWGQLGDSAYRWDDSRPSFAGVDVSLHHDSTAVVRIQQRADGRWHAGASIFYANGSSVDQAAVMQAVREIPNLAACAYDPRFWELAAQQLAEEGILTVEIPQTPQRMVPAIGNLYRTITTGGLTHTGAPDFASQVVNAVPRFGEGGFTLSKVRSTLKIDAAVALALALSITGTTPTLSAQDIGWY